MSAVSHRPRHLCILDQQSWGFPGHPWFYHDSRPEAPVCTHRSLRMRWSLRGRIGGYSGQYPGFQVFFLFLALASYFWTCMLTPILCLFILGSLAICFLIVKMILDIIEIYHREINFRYYLSLDNWYYNYVVEYVDHLYIGFCFNLPYFLPRSVLRWLPRSSLPLVDPFELFGHV